MIRYDKLWDTLKARGMSQTKLYNNCGISRSQIYRLKHNQVVYTSTLDMLCTILNRRLEDIATFHKE